MATLIGAMSLTSCTKDVYNPEMDPVNRPAENPWEDIAVPAGFNWSTIASVNLKVDVEDAYGGKYGYLIEAFPANPEEDPATIPLAAGYANLTQSYTTTLRMPQTVGNIYLRQTAPDGSQIVKTFAVQPQLDYTFAAAGSQAATKSEPGTPEFPIEVGMDHNSKNNWAYNIHTPSKIYGLSTATLTLTTWLSPLTNSTLLLTGSALREKSRRPARAEGLA